MAAEDPDLEDDPMVRRCSTATPPRCVDALAEAPGRGWSVVSMRDDWMQIFAAP